MEGRSLGAYEHGVRNCQRTNKKCYFKKNDDVSNLEMPRENHKMSPIMKKQDVEGEY